RLGQMHEGACQPDRRSQVANRDSLGAGRDQRPRPFPFGLLQPPRGTGDPGQDSPLPLGCLDLLADRHPPILPAAFRKLDAVAVLTGPLLPAPQLPPSQSAPPSDPGLRRAQPNRLAGPAGSGGVRPRCSQAAGVATRPRGVLASSPDRTRNGSATTSTVSISSPTATARVDSPTGPPPNRLIRASSTPRSSRSRPSSSTSYSSSAARAMSLVMTP